MMYRGLDVGKCWGWDGIKLDFLDSRPYRTVPYRTVDVGTVQKAKNKLYSCVIDRWSLEAGASRNRNRGGGSGGG